MSPEKWPPLATAATVAGQGGPSSAWAAVGVMTSPNKAGSSSSPSLESPAGATSTRLTTCTPGGSRKLGIAWSVRSRAAPTCRGTSHAPALSSATAAPNANGHEGRVVSAAAAP